VVSIWEKYGKLLTSEENKFGAIVGDRLTRIFNSKSIEEKDRFLTGVERVDFSKREQV